MASMAKALKKDFEKLEEKKAREVIENLQAINNLRNGSEKIEYAIQSMSGSFWRDLTTHLTLESAEDQANFLADYWSDIPNPYIFRLIKRIIIIDEEIIENKKLSCT